MSIKKWLLLYGTVLLGCLSVPSAQDYQEFNGQTMGTYYRVVAGLGKGSSITQELIDSKLVRINEALSTYIRSSLISQINNDADTIFSFSGWDPELISFFEINYKVAREVFMLSDGYFDPTVLPLVEYWGFGSKGRNTAFQPDSATVDSLVELVGFDKIELIETDTGKIIVKSRPGIALDFSAIAKGFAVDELAKLMMTHGIKNYLVDIGGEVRCRGISRSGNIWVIGINTPSETSSLHDVEVSLTVKNLSVATSGNYRNFYELKGQKYSHTINPMTGYPERNRLLSASILTVECILADALATACMSLGLEGSRSLIQNREGVDAVLIYADNAGKLTYEATPGIKSFLKENN